MKVAVTGVREDSFDESLTQISTVVVPSGREELEISTVIVSLLLRVNQLGKICLVKYDPNESPLSESVFPKKVFRSKISNIGALSTSYNFERDQDYNIETVGGVFLTIIEKLKLVVLIESLALTRTVYVSNYKIEVMVKIQIL